MKINKYLENKMPAAPLKIIVMDSIKELGEQVNNYLVEFRREMNQPYHDSPAFEGYKMDNYTINFSTPRFGSGEGKAVLNETVRGKDLYIMLDVLNNSLTYKMHGYQNYYSPDDHFMDLKRLIAATAGKAHRITVIMPFMYESRQHKKTSRESLDCALMLEDLYAMGVSRVITFDAHDPSVQNSAPLSGFDNFTPFYQFLRTLLANIGDLKIDKEHTLVISPDEGALNRAVYFANVMGVDTGMFYKRRDYTQVVDGKNPIVAHEFLGDNVEGKDVIIVDDMISSGGSMIDTARQLKKMNAKRVFICCTFGIFTDGLEAFDDAYKKGYFDKVICTNLTYRRPELDERPYFLVADMSKFLASIIDFSNHDVSMEKVITPTEKIRKVLDRYNSIDGTIEE
ncbi:ribose-phosphate pyrophosphokinase [Lachnospiraceae bacterium KH1T2]|nr:ribose-phosphate pyrophosphokinase [Lachnospiraceae bacterium KH1T2]